MSQFTLTINILDSEVALLTAAGYDLRVGYFEKEVIDGLQLDSNVVGWRPTVASMNTITTRMEITLELAVGGVEFLVSHRGAPVDENDEPEATEPTVIEKGQLYFIGDDNLEAALVPILDVQKWRLENEFAVMNDKYATVILSQRPVGGSSDDETVLGTFPFAFPGRGKIALPETVVDATKLIVWFESNYDDPIKAQHQTIPFTVDFDNGNTNQELWFQSDGTFADDKAVIINKPNAKPDRLASRPAKFSRKR